MIHAIYAEYIKDNEVILEDYLQANLNTVAFDGWKNNKKMDNAIRMMSKNNT